MALSCFICYLFTISLRYLFEGGKIQQLEWDMSTITAGDYTVEFPIKPTSYRNWYDHEYRKPGGDFEQDVSPALSLKRFLIKQIEEEMESQLLRNSLRE